MPETCGTCLSYSEVEGFPSHLMGSCSKKNDRYVAYFAVCDMGGWRPKPDEKEN